MSKITRDKLQNLVGKLYVESGNEFGCNSCNVVNNMMLVHSYIISNITTHIRRTRRVINIVEVVCIVLILLSLIIKSVPSQILEDLIYTTISVVLFGIFHRLRVRNYLKDHQRYALYYLSITYHYIADLADNDEELTNTHNILVETYHDFLSL